MIPPQQNAEFVAAMEDVFDVYRRPYDPKRPVVCLDEQSKQLVKETRAPMAAKPGRKRREDYEYERNGTANLFMLFEPLARAFKPAADYKLGSVFLVSVSTASRLLAVLES